MVLESARFIPKGKKKSPWLSSVTFISSHVAKYEMDIRMKVYLNDNFSQ